MLRTKSFSLPVLLCAVLLLTACVETRPLMRIDSTLDGTPLEQKNDAATQEKLRTIAAIQERLDHVSAPLLIKNQDLCKKLARPLLGFTAKNKYSYSPKLASAAQEALGLGELLQVTGTMTGSGAARSGLRRGDSLIAAGNKPMPKGPNAEYDAPDVIVPLLIGQSSIKLTVLRNGKSMAVSIPLTRACGFRIELGNTDKVNSYSDGSRIMVTRGMMQFVRSDDELAYVIAREMAHNALGHAIRQRTADASSETINSLMQVFPYDRSIDIAAMPKEKDAAADRMALFMLSRTAHNLDGVTAFWQRVAKQAGDHTAMHPATEYRLAAINKTLAELKARKSGNKTSSK